MHKTALALTLTLVACGGGPAAQDDFKLPGDPKNYGPVERFENMKIPDDNPITLEKAALGRQLFFDKRLSGKGDRSCYSCHLNDKGLTDGIAKNTHATTGAPLARHSPSLWNIGYQPYWYWDGRAATLEGQALAAWKLANMGAKDATEDKVRADIIATIQKLYGDQFQKAFGGAADEKKTVQALASYMRTIISKSTPFDRWFYGKDESAVNESAKRGYKLFNDKEKARCVNCHSGFFFTDWQFHNVGIGMKAEKPDVGRFTVTKVEKDTGAFKTPSLRDVTDSAPYFHDGSVATLEEAVKLILAGGVDNPHLDKTNLQPANLTDAEVKDLIEFLKALDEPSKLSEPKLP